VTGPRSPVPCCEETLLAELRDRHLGLVGRAGLVQEFACVALLILGYLVGTTEIMKEIIGRSLGLWA